MSNIAEVKEKKRKRIEVASYLSVALSGLLIGFSAFLAVFFLMPDYNSSVPVINTQSIAARWTVSLVIAAVAYFVVCLIIGMSQRITLGVLNKIEDSQEIREKEQEVREKETKADEARQARFKEAGMDLESECIWGIWFDFKNRLLMTSRDATHSEKARGIEKHDVVKKFDEVTGAVWRDVSTTHEYKMAVWIFFNNKTNWALVRGSHYNENFKEDNKRLAEALAKAGIEQKDG